MTGLRTLLLNRKRQVPMSLSHLDFKFAEAGPLRCILKQELFLLESDLSGGNSLPVKQRTLVF